MMQLGFFERVLFRLGELHYTLYKGPEWAGESQMKVLERDANGVVTRYKHEGFLENLRGGPKVEIRTPKHAGYQKQWFDRPIVVLGSTLFSIGLVLGVGCGFFTLVGQAVQTLV